VAKPNVQDRKSAIMGIVDNWEPEIVDVRRLVRNRVTGIYREIVSSKGMKVMIKKAKSVRAIETAKRTQQRRERRANERKWEIDCGCVSDGEERGEKKEGGRQILRVDHERVTVAQSIELVAKIRCMTA
jgi:ribonucleotide reductase alpha subunit